MAKIKKRAMMIKIGDSTFDKIKAFYIDPERYQLTDTQEEIRQRWICIITWQLKVFSKHSIVNMLTKQFGIEQAQAYIDIRNAENIFGSITNTDNDAYKAMWMEWTKDFLKRSRISGDKKAEGKALDLLAKYGDLGADNPEFNPEKLLNKEIQIEVPKEMLKLFQEFISNGTVDLNKLNVTDIGFEALP
jgi:hypothetical protein